MTVNNKISVEKKKELKIRLPAHLQHDGHLKNKGEEYQTNQYCNVCVNV